MDPTRRRARASRAVSIAAISLLVIAPGLARAQSAEADRRFKEAEALLEAGKTAEACDAFEASNQLEPSAGTLINIGLCKEKLGKLASALAAYRGALERVKDPKKKAVAIERVAALEPRISHISISISSEVRVEGLAVSLDGRRIDEAEYGRAIPIDGGSHELEAKAPGHRRWSTSVRVAPEGDEASVRVPALVEKRASAPAAPAAPRPAARREPARTGLKVVGWSLVGVSVASATYVLFTTVTGPIPAYEELAQQPLNSAGMEVLATSADCNSNLGDDLRNGTFKHEATNVAFDKACVTTRRRFIIGMVGLASSVLGTVAMYLAYRDDGRGATTQAGLGRRARRRLVVMPEIGPGGGGASLRLAW